MKTVQIGTKNNSVFGRFSHSVIDRETENIRAACGKMEKLIKHNMTVQYHEKSIKKNK